MDNVILFKNKNCVIDFNSKALNKSEYFYFCPTYHFICYKPTCKTMAGISFFKYSVRQFHTNASYMYSMYHGSFCSPPVLLKIPVPSSPVITLQVSEPYTITVLTQVLYKCRSCFYSHGKSKKIQDQLVQLHQTPICIFLPLHIYHTNHL